MDNTKRTLEEVIEAINGSDGIKTVIAKRLSVTRQTVDSYLSRWKTAQDAYDDAVSSVSDVARSVVVGNIKAAYAAQSEMVKAAQNEPDPVKRRALWEAAMIESYDARWWLARKERAEFAERHELTGKDGESLPTIAYIRENRGDDESG